jgi:hypothetical protein
MSHDGSTTSFDPSNGQEGEKETGRGMSQPGHQLMRDVNDRIYEVLTADGSEDGDFLCECGNSSCTETVQLTLREYAALRAREDGAVFACSHTSLPRRPKSRSQGLDGLLRP